MKILILLFVFFSFSNIVLANEIKILNETLGDGVEVINHSKVSVHYIGKLEDQTEFDNSYKRGEYFKFQIGTRQVIPGWEVGLLGMKVGGKRSIFIPYELAYGDKGAGNLIPPKSNLIFEIEVFEVVPPKYKEIDNNQLKLALTDYKFKVIDIRDLDEINKTGKIPNSIIITAFDKNGNFLPNFLNKYQAIVKPGEKVVFISKDGVISSILANGFVEQLKQENIYHLKDGIEGLKKTNFKFEDIKD